MSDDVVEREPPSGHAAVSSTTTTPPTDQLEAGQGGAVDSRSEHVFVEDEPTT
jgi:hypothetical protein